MMQRFSMERFRTWLGTEPDGGITLREERVGRWIYALVLGALMISLALDPTLTALSRVGLAWFLGLSVSLAPLSWVVAHVAEDRRSLAGWGASTGALLVGAVILVGLGQVGREEHLFVISPLGMWGVSLTLFGLTQILVTTQWQAFADHVRENLAGPSEPEPVSTVTVAVTAPLRPTHRRRTAVPDEVSQRQRVP